MKELNYDLVILGGGPAGLSAAIYAARGTLKTAIIDTGIIGGQLNNYLEIENYPGMAATQASELIDKFEKHVDMFGADKYILQEITKVDLCSPVKIVETLDYCFKAKTVIIATGAQPQKMDVPGESDFSGRGVSYCAVCDGAFFKNKDICVVGGGNAAVEEAFYLTKFASSVTIIHRRDRLRANKLYQEQALNNSKIKFIFDSIVTEVKGKNKVESVIVKNVKTGEIKEVLADGVFPYIGYTANSALFREQIQLEANGFIVTGANLATSVEGVFAAGDVCAKSLRQVITSASDGAIAATNAIKYLETAEAAIGV